MPTENEAGSPAPAGNENNPATADQSAPGTETPTAGAGDPAPSGETAKSEAPDKRTFTQDEVNDIVQKRLAKESRRIQRQVALETENRLLRERATGQREPDPGQDPNAAPTLEQFGGDYEAFNKALVGHEINQRLRVIDQQRAQQTAQQEAAGRTKTFFDAGTEKYEDFEDVIRSENLQITPAMREFTERRKDGIDVAYYLGNNPQEAAKIARLPSAVEQFDALVAIESALKAPPAVTKAPEPIKPSGPSTKIDVPLAEVNDQKDFIARRRATIKSRRR